MCGMMKGIHFILEQPSGSCVCRYAALAQTILLIDGRFVLAILQQLGHVVPKLMMVYATIMDRCLQPLMDIAAGNTTAMKTDIYPISCRPRASLEADRD